MDQEQREYLREAMMEQAAMNRQRYRSRKMFHRGQFSIAYDEPLTKTKGDIPPTHTGTSIDSNGNTTG